MYFKIYLRNWLKRPEMVCLKRFDTIDGAKAYKISLETEIKFPKGYYLEIQGFYE